MALIRSIATVGGYTMACRVLGFVRDVLIARVLGTGEMADAFFVAQRLPNLFRSLFAEGAFNAAFLAALFFATTGFCTAFAAWNAAQRFFVASAIARLPAALSFRLRFGASCGAASCA